MDASVRRTVLVWLIGTAGVFGPQTGAAAQQTTVFHGAELPYEVIDGWAVHAGDIILGTAEEAAASAPHGPRNSRDVPPVRRLAPYPPDVLWPEGIVPYVIDDDVAHPEWIREAIAMWNRETVVRLVERTTQRDYLRFAVGAGCFGVFGRGYDGGERIMPVEPRGCPVPITLHEIGHAIGMWHEQQRKDRDRWLTVFRENIDPGAWGWNRLHGRSSNPARTLVTEGMTYRAIFTEKPILRIEANVDPARVTVGDWRRTAPVSLLAEWFSGTTTVNANEAPNPRRSYRHRFRRWSDGGGASTPWPCRPTRTRR